MITYFVFVYTDNDSLPHAGDVMVTDINPINPCHPGLMIQQRRLDCPPMV